MARSNLQEVLEMKAKGIPSATAVAPAPSQDLAPASAQATLQRSATRVGKITVAGYFPKDVRSSLRMIQAKQPDRSMQDLLAEALNDLFAKHNVPQSAPREQL